MGKTKKAWTVHPGEILRTEFMEPMKITASRLAKDLDFAGIYDEHDLRLAAASAKLEKVKVRAAA